jgi:UDP:flavonoid glycosyltransferase YjiC (YdhE family)
VKTILFAWELGNGLGHASRLRRIAARLRPHGVRTIAVVKDVPTVVPAGEAFDQIEAAPIWPYHKRPVAERRPLPSATMNDMLSALGLVDLEAVQRLLAEWDEIFNRLRPDLIVADYSPLTALAARRRIPLVLVGTGFTVPPDQMPRFPLLHRLSPPAFDEGQTLATVNAAATSLGLSRLERLPELFSGDACLAQCFQLLDPYDTQRISPVEGPVFEEPPIPRAADADRVFAYLSSDGTQSPSIHESLATVAKRLRLHAPLWPKARLDQLAEAGACLDAGPQSLASILASSRLVIHHGGSGVAAEALAAGVPQLVLSSHIEQDLTGEAIERAGAGRLIKPHELATRLEPNLIQSLIDDDTMAARAAALGYRLRELAAQRDALMNCEAVCMGLLKENSA